MIDDFLTLRDVALTYTDKDGGRRDHVLARVSLTVPAGAFVALVGASGVGKSTLLRVIAGLLPPSAGAVRLLGDDPHASAAPIGIVFQRDNLMPWRTVAENVSLPLELSRGGSPLPNPCLLYTSPSPRDRTRSRMPSSA